MQSPFFIKSGDSIIKLGQAQYKDEYELQNAIFRCPEMFYLRTDHIDYQIYPVTEQLMIPSSHSTTMRADIFAVDSNAVPVIIEVKRRDDARIHSEVLAQLIDYAAHLKSVSFDTIKSLIQSQYPLNDDEKPGFEDGYFEKLKYNIDHNVMRLVIAADSIPSNIVTSMEFLNDAMQNITVYGIEVKKLQIDETVVFFKTVVAEPATIMAKKPSTSSDQWTEETLIKAFEKVGGSKGIQSLKTNLAIASDFKFTASYGSGQIYPVVNFTKGDTVYYNVTYAISPTSDGVTYINQKAVMDASPEKFSNSASIEEFLHKQGFEGKITTGKNYTTFYTKYVLSNDKCTKAFKDFLSLF